MKPLKVLLVEDNEADAELTRETLDGSRLPVDLRVAADGTEALDILSGRLGGERTEPDLILLDLNLPGLGGRQVLAAIKADDHLKSIPVVVLTSSDAESDVVASYQAGANCFITKPCDFTAYQQVVEALEGFWFCIATLPRGGANV
ncbi:MAG: response regulator [Alphaproteobacteria bacterium]|nr:response regulator [Alphaproteobacteria bacterium]